MSSLREITDGLKRPLEEKEVWTLLRLSIESLWTSYRDFKPSHRSIGPCLIISVDGLLLYKNNVQFNAGLQSEAAPDVAAPELLEEKESVTNLEQLQQAHIYSLASVLLSVMDSKCIAYSDGLQVLLKQMNQVNYTLRPQLEQILEIAQSGMEKYSSEDDLSLTEKLNDMLELESNNGEPNLAAEIAAVEQTPSVGGSSLSINSRASLDTLNPPGTLGRPVSWSSHERLKTKDQEKSQFYTPVRPRRKSAEDMTSLPPLPPSIRKRSVDRNYSVISPDPSTEAMPVLPPVAPVTIPPILKPLPDDLTSTPRSEHTLDSVKRIENILESNSAPDLFKDTPSTETTLSHPHYKLALDLKDNDQGDALTPPTPPPTSPPPLPLTSPIEHIHQDIIKEGGVAETSFTTPPVVPSDLIVGDSTFEYSSINELPPASPTTDEFQFTLALPLTSPSKTKQLDDSEVSPPAPPKRHESLATIYPTIPLHKEPESPPLLPTTDSPPPPPPNRTLSLAKALDYNEVDKPVEATAKIVHDENDYAIPFKKRSQILPLDEGPHTLGRPSNKLLLVEEVIKAPSADNVTMGLHVRLPHVEPPERYSMPIEPSTYEVVEVLESPTSSIGPPLTDVNRQSQKKKISQMLGQDEPTLSAKTSKRYSHLFKLESHIVTIEGTGTIHLRIKPTATCQELLNQIAKNFYMEEQIETLGIAQQIGDEYIFLGPADKVYKYAPSGWKSWKPGSNKDMPRFVVHFRVMYSPPKIAMLTQQESRHMHYEQAFKSVLSGDILVEQNEALRLAGLALQAQFGDYRRQTNYFRPINYLPHYILRDMSNDTTHDILKRVHEQRKNLTREKAEYRYLQEVSKLTDYGYIYYKIWKTKDNSDDRQYLLGFSTRGVKVCHIQDDGARKEDLICPWKTTTKIAFKNRKVILEVLGSDPVHLYTGSCRRARYYVKLSQLFHFFDRKYRDFTYSTPIDIRDEIIIDVLDYRGEFLSARLLKNVQFGLGITIKQHQAKSQKFAEIRTINKEGVTALEGTLQIGDLLVEVNKQLLIDKPHQEVGRILKNLPPVVDLKVFRRADYKEEESLLLNVTVETAGNRELSFDEPDIEMLPLRHVIPQPSIKETSFNESEPDHHSPSAQMETIRLKKMNNSFGFAVKCSSSSPSLCISKVTPGGAADKTGSLSVGDHIFSINGQSVQGKKSKEVFDMLRETKNELEIRVCRSSGGGDVSTFDNMLLSESVPPPQIVRKDSEITLVAESAILDESGPARSLSISDNLETVRLKKKNGSFGFAIQRSSKNPYSSVSISKITPGGAAHETRLLSVGDQLVSINGRSIDGKGYREVFDMLRHIGDELELQVCPPDNGSHVTVMLDKNKGSLGLRIKESTEGRIVVNYIVEGSQAEKSGQIQKGDEIVQVNGETVHGLSLREATELLIRIESPLYIYIKKPIPVINLETIPELTTRSKAVSCGTQATFAKPVNDNYHQFPVTLTKGIRGFGFKIRKDPHDERATKGLFIASVDYDPALSDGRLQCGDEIIEVNGQDFTGILHRRGVNIMKVMEKTGTMIIQRKKELRSDLVKSAEHSVPIDLTLQQQTDPDITTDTNSSALEALVVVAVKETILSVPEEEEHVETQDGEQKEQESDRMLENAQDDEPAQTAGAEKDETDIKHIIAKEEKKEENKMKDTEDLPPLPTSPPPPPLHKPLPT